MPRHLRSFLSSFSRTKDLEKVEDQEGSTTVSKVTNHSQPVIQRRRSFEIFQPKDLWQTAFDQLDDKQQQNLLRAQPESKGNKASSRELIDEIVQVTKQQYEEYQQKSDKILRKASRKIIDALLSYKDLISAAAGLVPTQHAASAWAVVSVSLNVCISLHQ